jgi:predicted nicotinamide N-methyase
MLALMERNIGLNGLQGAVQAAVYDWGQPTPSQLPVHPDIVLAADCVYFEPVFPLLQQTLKDLLRENSVCYFCFKKRRRADLQFMKTAKKMFDVTEVRDDPDKEVYSRENIYLFVTYISAGSVSADGRRYEIRKKP